MSPIYLSVFSKEIQEHLALLSSAGRYVEKAKCYLRSLDRFLADHNVIEKALNEELVTKWLTSKPIKTGTKKNMFAEVKRFAKYLTSLGVSVQMPEAPRVVTDYVPYIFSEEELGRIIYAADNFYGSVRINKSSVLFPILLRLLYGCGLRLGEGLALSWKDIDLENGVITVRTVKNMKQRFAPMSGSVLKLLNEYHAMTRRKGICHDYLFETDARYGTGKPYKNVTFEKWFAKVLRTAGINFVKSNPHERGPCAHCLRHLFVFDSFHKSESEGRSFEDTALFLSAYLGHENLSSLEKYLSRDYSLYRCSHQRINEYIKDVFPEVSFQ